MVTVNEVPCGKCRANKTNGEPLCEQCVVKVKHEEERIYDFFSNESTTIIKINNIMLYKVKIDAKYSVVLFTSFDDLNNFRNLNYYTKAEVLGLILNNLNAFVINNDFYFNNELYAIKNFESFKTGTVTKEIKNAVEQVIYDSQESKNVRQHIDKKGDLYNSIIKENKKNFKTTFIKQKEFETHLLPHRFSDNLTMQDVVNYLEEPEQTIKDLVSSLWENHYTSLENRLKAYHAYQVYYEEQKECDAFVKERNAYHIVENELEAAKKVWVLKADGSEIQVNNRIDIDTNVEIGDWHGSVPIEEVKSIKYGRKIFNL